MMDIEIEAKRAEKNAEKVRARKNRKATYFCEKRHKKHLRALPKTELFGF